MRMSASRITAFGIVMLGQAWVSSYGGLIATRFFLGFAEAGIFPGSFYLISFWYKREESQKRFTIYWSSVILAGAFGGLLATAISRMDGLRGMAAWQWIFCLEGIASILVGIAAYFFVVDFPKEASWLTPEEKAFVTAKTRSEESHAVNVTTKDVLRYLSDIKSHLGAIMYFSESSKHLVPPFLTVSSHRRSHLCLFLLFGDHHSRTRIFDSRDSVAYCSSLRSSLCLRSYSGHLV